jgi:hypothetical protein
MRIGTFNRMTSAVLLVVLLCLPASADDLPSLAKPGETFVSISQHICLGRCPAFDLYVFPSGKVMFRGNQFTPKQGVVYRTVPKSTYDTLIEFLNREAIFETDTSDRSSCWTDHPGITVRSQVGDHTREKYLYFGCENIAPIADAVLDKFVEETGTARLITNSPRTYGWH